MTCPSSPLKSLLITPPFDAYVFQAVSFPRIFQLKPYMLYPIGFSPLLSYGLVAFIIML